MSYTFRLLMGPKLYVPRIEVEMLETITPTIVQQNHALRIRATQDLVDSDNKKRLRGKMNNSGSNRVGEEWLVRTPGHYMPRIGESIVKEVDPIILSDLTALHLKATADRVDVFGKQCTPEQNQPVLFELLSYY